MQKLIDWLIIGSLTLGTGAIASLGGARGALLGSATGAVVGATISTRRLDNNQRDIMAEWEKIKAELPILKATVNELRKPQLELAKIEGKFVQKREELQQVEQKLTSLNQHRQELERRVVAINQQNSDLAAREQLQAQVEQFKLDRNGLEGQMNFFRSQVETLEAQKRSLVSIEVEFVAKQAQLELLNNQTQELQNKSQQKVNELQKAEAELVKVEGQFVQKQEELQQFEHKSTTLNQHKQELELRVLAINQHNPNLVTSEKLQTQIEQFRLDKSGLEGQINALGSQVENLEIQRRSLVSVEAEFAVKQAQLDSLNNQIQELQIKSQQLEQRAAELESLRATYDSLFNQKQSFEERVNQLKPEIDGLEAEKQRILQAIQENQQEYRTVRVNELREAQAELAKVEGQFVQKQEELQQFEHKFTTLNQHKQELDLRVLAINQHNPDLAAREQLQFQIEQFKLDKSGLEGQINALGSQVEALEIQRRSLVSVEAEFAVKQAQLDSLNSQIQELQTKPQQLEQRAAELELLRATYDGLFSQKQSFEERVDQLKPEIDRLEAERQRILQAIQENQQEYQKIEELRQKLHSLNFQIKDKESQSRGLEREIQQLNGIQAGLEENNARLKQGKEELQGEIKRLKGEIENLQSSAEVALRSLREPVWVNLPNQKRSIGTTRKDEQDFLDKLIDYIKSQGLTFPKRVIHAFHTSLKVQDISALVVLAGISGTGKSELPQRYADFIGAQLLTLAVQPRWDSPQDLQGFYNYVEKKFKPTDLMRGLYQYNHDQAMNDRIVIVLLDEMNLARIEYYFSEFLSKLETRRSRETYLEIDVGSLPLTDRERRLQIPNEFLFVGTMNEDETTQTLSDKVLDRANVITFGKPEKLQLPQKNQNGSTTPLGYLTYSVFKEWIIKPQSDSKVVQMVEKYLEQVNKVMEKMGHSFAHRVYQSITQYVVNYPGAEDVNSEAFRFAIADQFGQKLLPKLRGVMIEEAHEELDQLEEIIAEINDTSLIEAFRIAREGRYGQFQWQGLVYKAVTAERIPSHV